MRLLLLSIWLFAAQAHAQYLASTRTTELGNSILLATPVYMGEEYGMRLEYNLGGGTIALEAVKVGRGEEYSETQLKEEDLSLITEGYEAAIYVSRFSKPWLMGGFYWSLAMGYRRLDARWRRPAENAYGFAEEEDMLTHRLIASGMTGHARFGYRYVSEQMPVFIGALVGLRHFESKFEDDPASDHPPTSDDDRIGLSRMIMTRPEMGLELGFVF